MDFARIVRLLTQWLSFFHLLSPQTAPVWILEGDIKGFFDNINHEWLCRNVPMDRKVLRKWLKAGYRPATTHGYGGRDAAGRNYLALSGKRHPEWSGDFS